jgi:serine/threonine-protein kinase HipA
VAETSWSSSDSIGIERQQGTTRVHQENACQALATPVAATARKYEADGGPSLRTVAALLTRWSTADQLDELLRQTTVNVLVGNADAHAMNTSFTITDDGAVGLAPMYDVFSTIVYPQLTVTPGMYIDDGRDIRLVTRANLVSEAVSWGIEGGRADGIVGDLCSRAPPAMSNAIADIGAVPTSFAELLSGRVDHVSTSPAD